MNKNEIEVWKSHPDIPGIEVSTFGNVQTLDRVVSSEKVTRFVKGHVLKQFSNKGGYLRVSVQGNRKVVKKLVHRLVAQTYIPNPDNLPEINHKYCNSANNNVDNLEWCTHEENIAYRDKCGHVAKNNAPKSALFAINLSTLKVSHFRSQHEAGRVLEVNAGNINNTIKGRQKYAGGYWFVNDDGHAVDVVKSKLHDIGKTGLKIKHRSTLKMH
ncbi:NUMOD4 domain-containing protein [Companilactobacillus sp.]|uniref:NUMOD4 domain-containing protein n=1 Tax=Companilactobacillus sp. TaxID=2767905 RepID=UPI002622AEE6|nr:NUMOD4 domain-containing protein [Companilactobacillus sp.]